MLPFYATQLNSVEVNHSFRKLPTAAQVAGWAADSGPDFRLSFKAPQRITHFRRLRDCEPFVAEVLQLLQPLAESGGLGPVLFQLPPNLKASAALLDSFLAMPAFAAARGVSVAFEFRHPTWFAEEIYSVLRAHGAGLCVAETDELQTPEVHTAPHFTAYRLRFPGGYKPRQIAAFAKRFAALASTRDVFVYFKHEDEPTGALNALALRKALRRLETPSAKKARA